MKYTSMCARRVRGGRGGGEHYGNMIKFVTKSSNSWRSFLSISLFSKLCSVCNFDAVFSSCESPSDSKGSEGSFLLQGYLA